jgi:hypothetical protein
MGAVDDNAIRRGRATMLVRCIAACILFSLALSVNGESTDEVAAAAQRGGIGDYLTLSGRDVCVLGGGAAGMAAAVFAKDKGRSVVVIESAPRVGGQCDTLHFTPPMPGLPAWIDVGVQFFANTTAANEAGLGPWSIDSVGLVERFAGPGSVVPLDFTSDTTPNYAVNLRTGDSYGLQPPAPPTPEFLAAYGRLQQVLASYPWIDKAEVPSPVPAELLVPFSQFIAQHGLGPLVPGVFVPQLFAGGLGDFDRLTTLYALLNMAPTIGRIFSAPDAGFVVAGGCQRIYDGMAAYLTGGGADPDAVLTDAHTAYVLRLAPLVRTSVVVGVTRSPTTGAVTGAFGYRCGKIVVAYPQTADAMSPFQTDATERRVFDKVRTRYYFTGELSAAPGGEATDGGAFNMLNLDPVGGSPFGTPGLPAVTQLTRGLPYGPIQFKASANEAVTREAMAQIVADQLSRMPATLLANATLEKVFLHTFQPHFTVEELGRRGGAYAALRALQGHRGTYYAGSLAHFAVSYQLWNAAYELVQAEL